MALSKPIFDFLQFYFEQLFTHPIRTKAISSCIIASLGNISAQYLNGVKTINLGNVRAFAIFGLLFGGTIPHFFYLYLNKIYPLRKHGKYSFLFHLLIERLFFAPIYQAFSLYVISRLEGKSHKDAKINVNKLYLKSLIANLKFLTLSQFINFRYVPTELRVLYTNLIGFFWVIYLAQIRMKKSQGNN